ncbi:signal peptidase I [Arthrobacter sp. TMN-49]
MQPSDAQESGGEQSPEGTAPEPAEEPLRRDLRARRAKSETSGTEDGGTLGERVGHRAWAWGKELLTIIVIAVVLSFLIKTFFFRAFFIPSGSMENTLEIQDRIFVNLLVPEPFGLKRGDIVVFKDTQGWLKETATDDSPVGWIGEIATFIGLAPDNSQQHLVKRVIGLPGDKVVCCDAEGKLTINGTAITEPYLYPGAAPSEETFEVTVPEGKLWVMGDHRNNSQDSRAHQSIDGTGFVPIDDVEGRAIVIAWPFSRWDILGNYPDVFTDVPEPKSASVALQQPTAGQ